MFLPLPSQRLPIPLVPAARPDPSPLTPADPQVQGQGLFTGQAYRNLVLLTFQVLLVTVVFMV